MGSRKPVKISSPLQEQKLGVLVRHMNFDLDYTHDEVYNIGRVTTLERLPPVVAKLLY